ncbi:hypothetical protein PG984_006616 [Apiospora sp. TS-2023a]
MRYIDFILALAGLGELVQGRLSHGLQGTSGTEPIAHKLVARAGRPRCSLSSVLGSKLAPDASKRGLFDEAALYGDEIHNGTLDASSHLWRRTMTLPPDGATEEDMDKFMKAETADLTNTGFATQPVRGGDRSTAAFVPITTRTRKPESAGMSGLEGCTGLLLVSRKGMYGAHYWENMAFDLDDFWKKSFEDQETAFQKVVLDLLENGDDYHKALKGEVAKDIDDDSLRAYLMIPDLGENGQPDPYRQYWNRLKARVGELVPRLDVKQDEGRNENEKRWQEIQYHPAQDDEPKQGDDARGKMLVKFDPKHNKKRKQTVWIERKQIHDDEW